MSRADSRIAAAREVADWLTLEGEHKRAEDIRALIRTLTCLRATASSIHKELEDTRRACGMPTWEREPHEAGA